MLNALITHAYYLLILLAILEGPIVAVACGAAAALGFIDIFIAYGILVAGDLLPDLMYYWIGRWGRTMRWVRRGARQTRLLRKTLAPLHELWHTRTLATMASAKISYGLGAPMMVSAGFSNVPLGRFAIASLAVSFPYLGLLAALGYAFARVYGTINVSGGRIPEVLAIVGIAFACLAASAVYFVRSRLDLAGARRRRQLFSQP